MGWTSEKRSAAAHRATYTLSIDALDQEGRGVARHEGKVIFVHGALPGEVVTAQSVKSKPRYDMAECIAIAQDSPQRTVPGCPHFDSCGGCRLQHFSPASQIAAKQRSLEEALQRIGNVAPEVIYPAIHGPWWHYRYKARLSVRDVRNKGVLIGFHERASSFVADIHTCPILPEKLSQLLPALRELAASLELRQRIPQLELAVGTSAAGDEIMVLVWRILEDLGAADVARLAHFAQHHQLTFLLQRGGPQQLQSLDGRQAVPLTYHLPEEHLTFEFHPTGFTQINPAMNQILVRRTLALLDPQPGEKIVDFFCGVGNFTLPIAARGATTCGIEGADALVLQARRNAEINNLTVEFRNQDLMRSDDLGSCWQADKALLDPPREGAAALIEALPETEKAEKTAPQRLVYVSCNPSTLARDAAILVHRKGYRLLGAGLLNMFPHTAHAEAIATFVRT